MKLVENWKALWKSWTVQLAALGILLPDILQVVADNSALLPWFDDEFKNALRLACLVLIVFARHMKQESLKP